MTVKKGKELPFDIADIPAIEWRTQDDLRTGLKKYMEGLVRRYGR
jgi:hypothetical protein